MQLELEIRECTARTREHGCVARNRRECAAGESRVCLARAREHYCVARDSWECAARSREQGMCSKT